MHRFEPKQLEPKATGKVLRTYTFTNPYKGGPHSVSKIHINSRCKKRTQKLAAWTFLSWSWQPAPFYYVDARGRVLQKPAIERFEARRGLGEARRGLGEATPRTQNVLAQGQSEAYRDSKLHLCVTITSPSASSGTWKLNFWLLCWVRSAFEQAIVVLLNGGNFNSIPSGSWML